MAKHTSILGFCALVFAIVDLIHGQHNGDAHRILIHIPEFVFFLGFLGLLEIWAFKSMTGHLNVNRWLVASGLSFFSCVLGLVLFALSGGSFHGDGGPIALSFLLLYTIGAIAVPVALFGFAVIAVSRKRHSIPILKK